MVSNFIAVITWHRREIAWLLKNSIARLFWKKRRASDYWAAWTQVSSCSELALPNERTEATSTMRLISASIV